MAKKLQLHGSFPSKAGDSAYQVAQKNGFEGTEQEWLASLVGPQGPAGKDATGNPGEAVLYISQTLTDEQKEQARKNIDSAGSTELNSVYEYVNEIDRWIGKDIPLAANAPQFSVGDVLVVSAVDENGRPVAWERYQLKKPVQSLVDAVADIEDYIGLQVPFVEQASVGQTVVVKSVAEDGTPIEWEVVEPPSGIHVGSEPPTDPTVHVWINPDSDDEINELPSGPAGEDGGYYTPAITQPETGKLQFDWTASREDMPAVAPLSVTLPQGEPGADGKSAYQYAQDGGYTGTEEEFAEKLAAESIIPRIELSDSVTTIEPNKFYVFPEMTSLSITFGGEQDKEIIQEYKFRFISGETPTTLSLPESVVGDITVNANCVVEVSIIDGYAVSQSWAVSV